jgi:hypothetical protein
MDQADLGATSPTTNGGGRNLALFVLRSLPRYGLRCRHAEADLFADARLPRHGVAALILNVSFCDECVAKRVGLPARRIARVVHQIAETLIVTTQAGRCDACLKQTVVHRLG